MAAIAARSAAMLAYKRQNQQTRQKVAKAAKLGDPENKWLFEISKRLPENERDAAVDSLEELRSHRYRRLSVVAVREHPYLTAYRKLSYFVYKNIVSQFWFEAFILTNILLTGAATGLDLENNGRDPWTVDAVNIVSLMTLVVFTVEIVLKVIAEGLQPWRYFTDKENRAFNVFDSCIVAASYALLGGSSSGALGILRMLRLVRLLTFIKNVPVLRVIIVGLVQGLKSVTYIVMLLFLVIYIFAILGCLIFGENDPNHFGGVHLAMLALFQVSTLASWTGIAYVSWFGCDNYIGSPYYDENSASINTKFGLFQGFKCDNQNPEASSYSPFATGLFFSLYILVTAWVIMSLFIGVISMCMFDAFFKMKEADANIAALKQLEINEELEVLGSNPPPLKLAIDQVFEDSANRERNSNSALNKLPNNAGFGMRLEAAVIDTCHDIKQSPYFVNVITLTILMVGFVTGLETNWTLECYRMQIRIKDHDSIASDLKYETDCGEDQFYSVVVGILSQAIFTVELVVKLLSEGRKPMRFFRDLEDGSWNCLDFVIVVIGFLELTAAKVIFKDFPVVLLRLLRLLRVFRLAKTLPRLRSIVEALISGFSAVGWICLLIVVFNYIAGCMCMLIFRNNDPFHWGSVGRSMFTMLRLETLDSWDQILYIAVYGCDEYPAGYDGFTINNPASLCKHSSGFGWFGAFILFILVIFGSFMLPTVLIGIVSIKFDEASQRAEKFAKSMAETDRIIETAKAELPDFFDSDRLFNIQKLFRMLDTQSKTELVLSELLPFYYYSFDLLFGVVLSREQVNDLFGIADTDRDGNVSIDEFIEFIGVIKSIETNCKKSSDFAEAVFGSNFRSTKNAGDKVSFWNNAMARSDEASINEAWEIIIEAVKASDGDSIREKATNLFNNMDSDKTGDLDSEELEQGFNNCNIHMTKRQTNAFVFSLDEDGDGSISLAEFQALLFEKMGATSPDKKQESETEATSAEFPNLTRSETLESFESMPRSRARIDIESEERRRSAAWAGSLSGVRNKLKVLPPEMIEMRSMFFGDSSFGNNPLAIEADATGAESSAEAALARALAAVSDAEDALQKATAEAEAAGAVVENAKAARLVSFGSSTGTRTL